MKRYLFVILICVSLILSSSCSSDKPIEKTDDAVPDVSNVSAALGEAINVVVNKFGGEGLDIGMFSADGNMCETENGYYFINRNIIEYSDKESGISVPLCSRPECSHNGEDCNGYAAECIGLSYYKGRLYWVGLDSYSDRDWKINSMALDGTNRRTEKTILGFDYGYDGHATLYGAPAAFDGDYVYMMPERNTVENGVPNYYYYITRTSIRTGEVTELMSLHLSDTGEYSPNTYWTINGNNLYFYYATSAKNPESGLYRVNLTDLGVEKLFERTGSQSGENKLSIGSLMDALDGRLLMAHSLSFAHGAPSVYAFNEDKEEFEPIYSFNELSESDTNGVAFGSEGIVAIGYNEETFTYTVCVSDYNFKPVCKTEFSILVAVDAPDDTMLGSLLLAVGQKELIFQVDQFGGDNDRTYIVACPYVGGKARILFEYGY